MTQKTLSDETFRHILHEQIIKLCHSFELPLHWNKIGPKKFTNYQRAGIIVLFLRSKKSLRDFIRELKESRWTSWLGLKSLPGKSTLHDWQTIFDLKTLRLFQEILLCKEKPSLMAIDATGIDSWQRSRHYEKRMFEALEPYERLKNMLYAKLRKMKKGIPGGFYRKKCMIKDPEYNRRCRVESVFNAIKHRRLIA